MPTFSMCNTVADLLPAIHQELRRIDHQKRELLKHQGFFIAKADLKWNFKQNRVQIAFKVLTEQKQI